MEQIASHQKAGELFICCSSFEVERCLAGPTILLNQGYRANWSVIFHYENPDLKAFRIACVEKLVPVVQKFTAENVEHISGDLSEPEIHIGRLTTFCHQSGILNGVPRVTIDITTFTKKHLLMLLKCLNDQGYPPERLFYTRTAKPIFSKLTEGAMMVHSIAGFSGVVSPRKPSVLFIFLGFEPDRVIAINRAIEPGMVIAVLSTITGTDVWTKRMREIHKMFLNRNDVRCLTVKASDPIDSYNAIEGEVISYGSDYNFCIAPLGTKAQTVGIYEIAKKYPDVQLIYCPPYRYLPNYPRRGSGETIVYKRDVTTGGVHYRRYPSGKPA